MSLVDQLAGLLGISRESSESLEVMADSEGLVIYLARPDWSKLLDGNGSGMQRLQLTVLRMLEEQGHAEQLPNGYRVPTRACVLLDDDSSEALGIAPRFQGSYRLATVGVSTQSTFEARLFARLPDGEVPVKRRGPYLVVSTSEKFLLTEAELSACKAWERHSSLAVGQRSEQENLRLIAELQRAASSGLPIDMAVFKEFEVTAPESVGLAAIERPDGGLTLYPTFGDGNTPEQVGKHLGHLDIDGDGGALRIGNRITLLSKERLEAVREVMANRVIPKERVADFIRSPGAFVNGALVDLELGFSVRVAGVGPMKHIDFGAEDSASRDWFGKHAGGAQSLPKLLLCEEDVVRFEEVAEKAWAQGATIVEFDGADVDVSDREAVRAQVGDIRESLTSVAPIDSLPKQVEKGEAKERATLLLKDVEEVGARLLDRLAGHKNMLSVDWDGLKRSPFEHQHEGVDWITNTLSAALSELDENPAGVSRIQGALLADDMGLGKTYMALVAAQAYLQAQAAAGRKQKPILVVAPLSLLENWSDEIDKTFAASPFRDLVLLQSERDLHRFRVKDVPPESAQKLAMVNGEVESSQIRYALTIGPEAGAGRLDMDRRLVLATYQTLRDYQFSLCRIDWGLVILDEAQNIKSPNTYTTKAAMGLKADFRLLATGTPVENTLGDFWCLFETAQPGLLGTWPQFRERYVLPIQKADPEARDSVRAQIGAKLRAAAGAFMLRRTKEERLTGLPAKTIHYGARGAGNLPFALSATMAGRQLGYYEDVLSDLRQRKSEGQALGAVFSALSRLRQVSLHPDVGPRSALSAKVTKGAAVGHLRDSAKLSTLIPLLEFIHGRGEKVILFMISKSLQRALKLWLDAAYGLDVGIVNGDTAAFATSRGEQSRKQIIAEFEAQPGFNILIMSPVAAGVGLTIIGANHVVHVERHWNPAKEAQATDRVYRIGQQRDVHVYLPASLHPHMDSFDVVLDRLLSGKLMLKDAVVTSEEVGQSEMVSGLL